jgi:uncharacterized protein YigA (DUF484 family)
LDVANETHVEHAIGLVENQVRDRIEPQRALSHQIEEPTRRCHENARTTAQGHFLAALTDATEHDRVTYSHESAVGSNARVNLRGELTRRRDDENANRSRTAVFRKRGEPLKERQHECGRLAGTGLRTREHVVTRENVGNNLRLDGRRCGISFVCDGANERRT